MHEDVKVHGKFEIVVMTKPETFEIHEDELLRKVCEDALSRAGYSKDLSKWELKDSSGKLVSFDDTEEQAGVKPENKYFLTQKIGAGGH